MNKKRIAFIYELLGRITSKKLDKVYNKTSVYHNQTYWRLEVNIKNKPEIKEILVIIDFLENKRLFQQLEQWENYQQNYLFYCRRKPGAGQIFRLINWKELNNHGSN